MTCGTADKCLTGSRTVSMTSVKRCSRAPPENAISAADAHSPPSPPAVGAAAAAASTMKGFDASRSSFNKKLRFGSTDCGRSRPTVKGADRCPLTEGNIRSGRDSFTHDHLQFVYAFSCAQTIPISVAMPLAGKRSKGCHARLSTAKQDARTAKKAP
jgi:hypothetical protein